MFESVFTFVILFVAFIIGTLRSWNYVVTMLLVVTIAAIIAAICGTPWKDIQDEHGTRLKKAAPVLAIFLGIGALVGGFMFSGTLPMIIYYGLKIVSPKWIALFAFVLCAIFSVCTGSSNASASTAGLAMVSLAAAMPEVNMGIVVGACLGGAVFGDKLSPLSDTTIMSSAVTENDIWDHIKHMAKTVIPGALLACVIYVIVGFTTKTSQTGLSSDTQAILDCLDGMYKWSILLLLPIVIVIWGAVTGKPSAPVLFVAAFVAVLIGIFYQGFKLNDGIKVLYDGFAPKMVLASHPDFDVDGINSAVNSIVKRGGVSSMAKNVFVIFIGFYFAAIAKVTGMLDNIVNKLCSFVKNDGTLVLFSGIIILLLTAVGGSTSVSIIIGGEMFNERFKEYGLHTLNLSRNLEDFGTGSTAFFPWSSSGMLYASVFSTTSLIMLKYAYMQWFIWILAIFYGFTGFCMKDLDGNPKRKLFGKKA